MFRLPPFCTFLHIISDGWTSSSKPFCVWYKYLHKFFNGERICMASQKYTVDPSCLSHALQYICLLNSPMKSFMYHLRSSQPLKGWFTPKLSSLCFSIRTFSSRTQTLKLTYRLRCPVYKTKGKESVCAESEYIKCNWEQKAFSFEKQKNEIIPNRLGLLELHSDGEMRWELEDPRITIYLSLTKTISLALFLYTKTPSSRSFSFNFALEGPSAPGLVKTSPSAHSRVQPRSCSASDLFKYYTYQMRIRSTRNKTFERDSTTCQRL